MWKYNIVTNAFISKICCLYTQAIRKHPLKQQTVFLETDAFDSSALLTETGIVLFQLPKCMVLAMQSTMQKNFVQIIAILESNDEEISVP